MKEKKYKVRFCKCGHVELFHRRKVRCEYTKCKCKKFHKRKSVVVVLHS